MNIWRGVLAAAIAAPLAFGLAGAPSGSARAETQGIVAIANDSPITERDITERIKLRTIIDDLPPGGLSRQAALQDLIDDQVKSNEATRMMLMPSDGEISDRIARLAKSMQITREQLLDRLKKEGISEADLRRYVQVSLAFTRIIAARYREEVTATPAEIDAKIAEIDSTIGAQVRKIMNDPRMRPVTVYSLMEINLPIDGEDPGLLQSRAVEAQQVMQRFKGCGNARKAAEGVFNVQFGKRFDADAAKIPKPMKAALDKAGQGRAIGPMRGKGAIQLIALCDVRTVTPPKPDFKMPTREQIERLVINEKYDKLEQEYLATAREKVYVEYRDPKYAQQ
jgi:peptidyl-prolyl cis-trans isomerase SurA